MKHRGGETAGLGVLPAGMVAGKKNDPPLVRDCFSAVREARSHFEANEPAFLSRADQRLEGDLSQRQHDANVRKKLKLFEEIGAARGELICGGPIVGGSAARCAGDPSSIQAKLIVSMQRLGATPKPRFVKRAVEPIPAGISGKGTPGSIRPVRSGSKADDEETGEWIAEAGDRPSPIELVLISAALRLRNLDAVPPKARALLASDDSLGERWERRWSAACHDCSSNRK